MIITLHDYHTDKRIKVETKNIEDVLPKEHGGRYFIHESGSVIWVKGSGWNHVRESAQTVWKKIFYSVELGTRPTWQEKIRIMNEVKEMESKNILNISIDEGAILPIRAHDTDAGLDIKTPIETVVPARGSAVIDTGIHVEIPKGFAGIMLPKSGLNINHDIITHGVIDCGYTGSIRVKMYNTGDEPYHVHVGDKVTQLLIVPVALPEIRIVDKVQGGQRADKGFGSTGK